jgi:dUTP pyrophosphatase
MILQFKHLDKDAISPAKHYLSDACWDLFASVDTMVKNYTTVPTGIAIDIPHGYCGMIMSRSGLASKEGVFVLNAPGIIDAGYGGEIKVVLGNLSKHTWEIERGERIAQFMLVKLQDYTLSRSDSHKMYGKRGDNGFGSTGY